MSVTFVVGRAGTGKTTRTLELICEEAAARPLGPPLWLIVPKQATFEYQRALVARLHAFARIRVVGMDELVTEVEKEVGQVSEKRVTAAGRQMIIGRLLYVHQDELQYFASSARRPGLAGSIDRLFDDFERSGKSLDQLDDVVGQLDLDTGDEAVSPSLHGKLADLQLLYRRYQAVVGTERLDPQGRRNAVLLQLGKSTAIRGADVYVDAFHEFAENERRMLAAIAGLAARMEVNLTLSPGSPVLSHLGAMPDELSPFYRTEVAFLRLHNAFKESGVTLNPPIRLTEPRRFIALELQEIERRIFNSAEVARTPAVAQRIEWESPVVFLQAPDPRVEVQAVARRIRDLLAAGYRQRDILVLTRDLEIYRHIIHAAFAEHGLTYFADRRRSATHHPLVRMVRAVVRIARENWAPAAVLALAKTGLAGISSSECDRFENVVVEQGISAEAWWRNDSWKLGTPLTMEENEFDAPPFDEADLPASARTVEQIRAELRDRLAPLDGRLSHNAPVALVRDLAAAFFETLEQFNVRQTLSAWIIATRGPAPEQAEEHEQVWVQFAELMQQMVEVLGDERVEPAEFLEVLESGMDGFDLAITPATLDQVLVGSVDRTRTLTARAVFVLGLNRSQFPATQREDSLLSNPERRELHKRKVEVDPDAARRQLDERFLGYVAFTRASQRLYVSRCEGSDRGQKYEPSEFWLELRRIVPDAPVVQAQPCTGSHPECLSTPRDLVSTLLDLGRKIITQKEQSPAETDWRYPLYNWLSHRSDDSSELSRLVRLAWPSLRYDNRATLSPVVADALFPSPLTVSAAQLETFAACPFQHFAAYGLKLSGRGAGALSLIDLSRIYHDALTFLVDEGTSNKQRFADIPMQKLAEFARAMVPQIAEKLRGEMMNEPRSQYIVDRVTRILNLVTESLQEFLRQGSWEPKRTAVVFGPTAALKSPEIAVANGKTVRLTGRIDRLDIAPDGAAAIYDYRLGSMRIVPNDVYHGLSLRLLAAALVVQRAVSDKDKAIFPVAALSSSVQRSFQELDHPSEAADIHSPEFLLAAKPRGLIRQSHLGMFDKATQTGNSPVVSAFIKKDGSLGNRHVTDVATDEEFVAMIEFVEKKVAEIAGQILAGRVAVEPYKCGNQTPCPRCDFISVCRFERTIDRYRLLKPMDRAHAVEAMGGPAAEERV